MHTLLAAYAPLILLIYLMVKPNSMASSKALPLCAFVAYALVLWQGGQSLAVIHANVISGILLAFTPLAIIGGAVFLFKSMEITGALDTLKQGLNQVSSNPIAQLMIVGWAFAFLIEGASGFGTPAAIAAPVLCGLGFAPLRVAMFCLVLNTVPVTFGAMGTPVWFGLSLLSLPQSTLMASAQYAAGMNTLIAPVIVFIALRLVIPDWRCIFRNGLFVLLATCACTLPYLALSFYSVEFPSLLGGFVGLVLTVLLARFGIGLDKKAGAENSGAGQANSLNKPSAKALIKAAFPLWGTILLLVVTRLPELGLKGLLQATEPYVAVSFGWFGQLSVSASLVVTLSSILDTATQWRHSLLYVPSLIPFVVIALASVFSYGPGEFSTRMKSICGQTASRMINPLWALLGALVFVNMMMLGDADSAVSHIGGHLASLAGDNWAFFAPVLGALGSFFSGSATISNLTFSGIQYTIAAELGLPLAVTMALQNVGAAMGNMVCINNIVAVTAILGLQHQDGNILKRTAVVLLLYAVLAGTMGAVLAAVLR